MLSLKFISKLHFIKIISDQLVLSRNNVSCTKYMHIARDRLVYLYASQPFANFRDCRILETAGPIEFLLSIINSSG